MSTACTVRSYARGGQARRSQITKTERELAERRHEETRDHVASEWELEDDFLTGSVAVFALLKLFRSPACLDRLPVGGDPNSR